LKFKITVLFVQKEYSCEDKAEFTALLQSLVSHDPSEIILTC